MSETNNQQPYGDAQASAQQRPAAGSPEPPAGFERPAAGAARQQPAAQQQPGTAPASQQPTTWYEAARARSQAAPTAPYGAGVSSGAYAAQQPTAQQPAAQQAGAPQPPYGQPAAAQQPAGYAPQPTAQQPTARQQAPFATGGNVPPARPPMGSGSSVAPGGPEPHKEKKPHVGLRAAVVGLVAGVVGAAAIVGVLLGTGVIGKSTTTVTTQGPNQTITIDPSSEDTSLANAVAAKDLPSVVSIYMTTSEGSGVGSGVVLDTEGHILTNYHVVEGATSLSVSANGKTYDAKVVGSDESSDLAVVKIDPGSDTLTPIEVGDSSSLQVGDWVMSIGSPFGLEQSVSTGIVSSLYRSTMLQGTSGNTIYTNLIQTDAAINPGNSGGALVDDKGKLVGINSIIESASGSSSGVGFAIPSNYAVEIAQKIINGETITHAYLGGSFQTVTAQNASRAGLSVNQGAYVAEVTSGSPADKAGIKQGDVITAIDGEEITSSDGVVLAVRSHNVGDTVSVTLVRGSQTQTLSVTLGSDEALQNQRNDDSSSNPLLDQYGNGSGNSGSGSGSGSGNGSGSRPGSGSGNSGSGLGGRGGSFGN
ncbi:trypsin-like peptidase domain-containing protein [uncultured Parolsenella sp.]|uniref:S1C family serine protease n=1 Tax=uncultured Parolsenella sp. TaxID=2083008 RepID=UPI0027D9983C|nr:trypsin-like peptidase domain-containing protein [uncultured Parolsenella sp.]